MKSLFAGTPFLDLTYQFGIDLGVLSKHAQDTRKVGTKPIVSFDEFKKRFEKQLWRPGLRLRREFDQEDACCDELLTSAEFLRQLPDAFLTKDCLDEHLSRFEKLCRATLEAEEMHVDTMRSSGVPALLQPFLRLVSRKQDGGWSEMCASRLESTIEHTQDVLRSRRSDVPQLLEFKNTLLFGYIVICNLLHVGLSTEIFSDHLFLRRTFSLTRWASLSSPLRLQYAALCLYMAQRFFSAERPFKTQIGVSINALSDLRSVLEDAVDVCSEPSPSIHLYVFRWFLDKLEAEVFSVQHHVTDLRAIPALTYGEQSAVVELVRRLLPYRYPVTADHLEMFLLQFGSTSRIRGAIRLLSSIRFYPLWQLAEAVERILSAESAQHGRLVIAPLGDLTGSTSIIGYLAAHSRLKKLLFVEDVPRAIAVTQSGGRMYFVDDCVLSGTQTLNIVGDLMGTRDLKKHHTRYCQALSDNEKRALSQRKVVFLYCIACDYAVQRLNTDLALAGLQRNAYEVLYSALEPLSIKAFGSITPVPWASPEERDELKRFCAEVGYDLLAERAIQKSWTDKRRRESSLPLPFRHDLSETLQPTRDDRPITMTRTCPCTSQI